MHSEILWSVLIAQMETGIVTISFVYLCPGWSRAVAGAMVN